MRPSELTEMSRLIDPELIDTLEVSITREIWFEWTFLTYIFTLYILTYLMHVPTYIKLFGIHTVHAQELPSPENRPLSNINRTTSKERRQTSKKCRQFIKPK